MAYSWPLPLTAVISQRFGTNPYSPVQPSGHTGMDFAVPEGTSVKAIGPGTVLWADWATKMSPSNPWYIAPAYAGIVVLIDHDGRLITVSAHLSDTQLHVGQRVQQGQEIGKSGNTGLSTGPHLHMEAIPLPMRVTNALYGRADPLNYMSAIVTTANTPLAPNQRRVGGSNVNHRAEPNSNSRIIRVIDANTIETFSGYVRGESVTIPGIEKVRHKYVSDLWYKDADGYAWAGGFTEDKTAGLPNLTPAPPKPEIAPNERIVVGSGAVQRAAPDRTADIIRDVAGGTKEAFTGFVRGEPIVTEGIPKVRHRSVSDIWFKDSIGYIWCGGFTNTTTNGLPDQTPAPGTRTSGTAAIAYREAPTLDSEVKWYLPANTTFVFDAFTHGDEFDGSDIWYRGRENKYWAHASLFTSRYTGGLTEVKYEMAKPAAPQPTPKPEEETYSFTPDFDFVEYKPANYWNMINGQFPTDPQKIAIHQFDSKDKRPSLDGVINHFQTPRKDAPSSAHFGVSKNRIVQFVSLEDRAQHAGPVGNDYIGIEVDPQEDAETIASVKKLIKALNKKYGKVFTYTDHRSVLRSSTLCGADIHLEKYDVTEAPVAPPVTPEDPDRPTWEEIETAERVLKWAKDQYQETAE